MIIHRASSLLLTVRRFTSELAAAILLLPFFCFLCLGRTAQEQEQPELGSYQRRTQKQAVFYGGSPRSMSRAIHLLADLVNRPGGIQRYPNPIQVAGFRLLFWVGWAMFSIAIGPQRPPFREFPLKSHHQYIVRNLESRRHSFQTSAYAEAAEQYKKLLK